MTQAWLFILIPAGAAIGGGLVSGAYQHVRDWWTRPKLQLSFKPDNDKVEVTWGGDYPFDGINLRASVRNRGIRPASNCKVFVSSLVSLQISGTTLTGFKDSRQAPWAGWSFEARTIHQGVVFYMDFVRVSKDVPEWKFPFERTMAQDKALQGYRGTYRFRLVAVADNAKPDYLDIDVKYEGDWRHLQAWLPPSAHPKNTS